MDLLLTKGSYLGIILFLVLTGCGLPVPEEVPIIFAGVMSANGTLNTWLALGACIIGAVLGDSMMYWFGHHFGRSGLAKNRFMVKIITPEREAQVETMIHRHGLKVFLTIRFLAGVRAPIYVTCGIMKVPYRKFLVADAISASVVVSVVFGLSYFIGDRVAVWVHDVEYALTAVAVVVAIGVGIFFWIRYRRRKAERAAEDDASHISQQSLQSPADAPAEESHADEKADSATTGAEPKHNGAQHTADEQTKDRSISSRR